MNESRLVLLPTTPSPPALLQERRFRHFSLSLAAYTTAAAVTLWRGKTVLPRLQPVKTLSNEPSYLFLLLYCTTRQQQSSDLREPAVFISEPVEPQVTLINSLIVRAPTASSCTHRMRA
jgi:hypothetical protein